MDEVTEMIHTYYERLQAVQLTSAPVFPQLPKRRFDVASENSEFLKRKIDAVPYLDERRVTPTASVRMTYQIDWVMRQIVFSMRMAEGEGVDIKEIVGSWWVHVDDVVLTHFRELVSATAPP